VFALDIYGKGIRPKDAKEAGALAGKYKGDRELLRSARRPSGGAAEQALTDTKHVAAIGYCFAAPRSLNWRGAARIFPAW